MKTPQKKCFKAKVCDPQENDKVRVTESFFTIFNEYNVGDILVIKIKDSNGDIIVNKELVVEFKTIKSLTEASEIQARNYLRLTGLNNALLINYPPGNLQECEIRCVTSIQESETPSPLIYKNEVFPRDI